MYPGEFKVERQTGSDWVEVPLATFAYRQSYTLTFLQTIYIGAQPAYIRADDGIQIPVIQDETASVQVTVDTRNGYTAPLYALDVVRARYDSHTLFQGRVYRTTLRREKGDSSDPMGFLSTFSASLKGKVGIALSDIRCWTDTLPAESSKARLARFGITVQGA
jgi:hypothetical protein